MMRKTKEWDVRCPKALGRMFPVRRGWYYKVDRKQAQRICNILARAYRIPAPRICSTPPDEGFNGSYWTHDGIIQVHARGHMKTVFHEFYHHLDITTGGRYNSDDRRGGDDSLAWQFADRLFEVFRHQRS